jgi:hypothetical protein
MRSEPLIPDTFDCQEQLGEAIIVKSSNSTKMSPVEKCLEGKFVLLYFGAQWLALLPPLLLTASFPSSLLGSCSYSCHYCYRQLQDV